MGNLLDEMNEIIEEFIECNLDLIQILLVAFSLWSAFKIL